MTPEQVRQIVREERAKFDTIDRYTIQKLVQMFDGRNFQLGKTTGTKFGTASDQKIGFWNTTPVDQPETVADPETQTGSYVQADVQSIADKVKDLIDRLQESGLIK